MINQPVPDPNSKETLYHHINLVYGLPGEPILKEEFLHRTWESACSLVRHNRTHKLIQNAVGEYSDLCARVYVLLTILHGAYSHEPNIVTILKDLVGLLDKDLVEEEMQVCAYAEKASVPYFPGLLGTWENIQHVYREKYFPLSVLPRTPHLAYVLYTLNRAEAIGRPTRPEEVFGTLSVMHAKMGEIHSIVQASQSDRSGK